MSGPGAIAIVDVTDEASFELLPPCADGRFDHRSCDYWEDEVRGSKDARPSWWRPEAHPSPQPVPSRNAPADPFAPPVREAVPDPFARGGAASDGDLFGPLDRDDLFVAPGVNPFAPAPPAAARSGGAGPRKLRLLQRGQAVFGSYAKVLLMDEAPAVYAQFGPLSAFPRARALRDLYPQLPQSPLPAVITCVATTAAARGRGLGMRLVEEVCHDLAGRGFAAVEAYPDLALSPDLTSSAYPAFWDRCGFRSAVEDERFPVMRRELE